MNSIMHGRISKQRWGGQVDDYLPIHDFIDSTKSLCSDGRHRILHTMWGVNHVIVPIFGHTIINSDGKSINVKDMCERDHLLVDYNKRFIPTLSDFADSIEEKEIPDFARKIERFHAEYIDDDEISTLMMSPLSETGQLKSLFFTHNSWFLNTVLPQIFSINPVIQNIAIAPSDFFNAMTFEYWMDNGMDYPESAKKLQKLKQKVTYEQ